MRKKEISQEELIDWWLSKYHDTTLKEVIEKHPQWMEDPEKHSRTFFKTYEVTQAQHDEWRRWFLKRVSKQFNVGKKVAERMSAFTYLDVAPSVKMEKDEDNNDR